MSMRLKRHTKVASIQLWIAAPGLLLLVLAWLFIAAGNAAACGPPKVIRDYPAPLERMPSIHEPPVSGQAPFAPSAIKLDSEGERLIAGRGPIGFSLSNNGDRVRQLDWIVETRLLQVNRKGRVIAKRGVRRYRVPSIQAGESRKFLRTVPGEHAFYRMDIRLAKKESRRVLGAYGIYARAVPERAELQLKIETSRVVPGEYAYATLVNPGTVPVEFNSRAHRYEFQVSAFTGEQWIAVGHNPQGRTQKHRRRTSYLPAGTEARRCIRYLVPEAQAPGLFRFSTLWTYDEDSQLAEAPFEVVVP